MAGQTTTDNQSTPYLTNTQQDLLIAALTSNKPKTMNAVNPPALTAIKRSSSDEEGRPSLSLSKGTTNGLMFASPQQVAPSGSLDFEETPYLDYLDGDASFDMDDNEFSAQMIGDLPGQTGDMYAQHDKRKNIDDEDDDGDEDGDPKRREGNDKSAKKPGRKPLTSEPTTKRKAQNRAAQRAFRERKERHLKDLETKVQELTKLTETEKREKSLLKAQIERLNAELVEYKKRMSSDATRNRSPPIASLHAGANTNGINDNNFSFNFPTFGALPGTQLFGSPPGQDAAQFKTEKAVSPPIHSLASLPRQNSASRSYSPKSAGPAASSVRNGSSGGLSKQVTPTTHNAVPSTTSGAQQMKEYSQLPSAGMESFAGLFSPGLLNGSNFGTENNDYGFTSTPQPTTVANDNGTDNTSGLSRVFRFNSGSTSSHTDSPSASSQSQWNANSSCDTSPEPSHPSPGQNSQTKENVAASNTTYTLNDANTTNALTNSMPLTSMNGFDFLASQNDGQFDPVLFGDYRDSQNAIVGGGDFNNGFFNDAFPYDFGSPFNFDVSSPKPQPQQQQQPVSASKRLLAEVEKNKDGVSDEYGCPDASVSHQGSVNGKLLNCDTIWNQLQSNQDFQDGKFDLDSLCSELRAKAKCTESGVSVPEDEVDAAFKKLSGNNKGGQILLGFEQNHVDAALKNLGVGGWSSFAQM